MKSVKPSASPARQRGVALLEALVAILIIAIALIGLLSLQANMVKSAIDARDRNEAARVVQQQVTAIWASTNPQGLNGSVVSAPTLKNGTVSTVIDGACTATATPVCTYVVTAAWTDEGQPRQLIFTTAR